MARDDIARLRGLAGEKGFRIEKAIARGCFHLVDEKTGEVTIKPNGSAAFTMAQAFKFLRSR